MRKNRHMLAAALLLTAFPSDNSLTMSERQAGWELLFNGWTKSGWHNFKKLGVSDGWQVVDGALTIVDPDRAGDIMTDKVFEWFELSIDVKIEKGQNSGIMFRVQNAGEATWHSGPEVQIYDHRLESGVETTGFLYQLYGSTVDAAKPAGEWNRIQILISPEVCWTKVNGVKYYEFVWGSDDFWARIAKSKFAKYPQFAKAKDGAIAIQGDHGHVAFKNIKIRRISS